jgi:hypothetical protein
MEWQDFKAVIIRTATEALDRRYKSIRKKGPTIWNDYTASLVNDKKKACLKFLSTKLDSDKIEYKRSCAIVKRETKKLHPESWDRYESNLEHDAHGAQVNAYKIMKYLNKAEKDTVETNNISKTGLCITKIYNLTPRK